MLQTEKLEVTVTSQTDGAVVVWLRGELDLATEPAATAILRRVITRVGTAEVIIDFTNLRFLDGAGIRALVGATEIARRQGRTLGTRHATGQVEEVLWLTGVTISRPAIAS